MILMNDFKAEYKFFENALDKVIKKSLRSGWYILGGRVSEFENNFAKFIGTKYAIGVANGMEALQISLLALGIGDGDEVITVSNSAVATALAITNVGAKPVFADIDEYQHLDVSDLEKKISKKTKAVIPVHLFGQSADIGPIIKIAKKHKLKVVEDACQAHGAKFEGRRVGSFSDLGCFSFYPTKNLGAYGDGGMITTNSKKLYELCLMYRNYGQKNRYEHLVKGLNSRLDELHAAILNEKLKSLVYLNGRRKKAAKRYFECLRGVDGIELPKVRGNGEHVFHLFVIKTQKRDKLQKYLKDKGINTLIHYPIPIHKQRCLRGEFKNTKLPETEKASKLILSLPIHPFIEDREIEYISKIIKEFFKK